MLRQALRSAAAVGSAFGGHAAKLAVPPAQGRQRRHMAISHPGQGKNINWGLGFKANPFSNKTVTRIMGQSNAGTHIPLGRMGAHTKGNYNFKNAADRPYVRHSLDKYKRMLGQPAQKAIISKLQIRKPRRPNSGKVLCCIAMIRKPSIRTGEPVATKVRAWIGNKGAPLREYSVIELGRKHKRGVQVKYTARWAKYDFPALKTTIKKRKQYGGQLGY